MKILTKNGVLNTNLDGARMNNFAAGMRDGVIKGALNECELKTNASNSVYIDTGVLLIQGNPVVIDEPIYQTLVNPARDERYAFIARITIGWLDYEDAGKRANVGCAIFVQDANKVLRKDNLFAKIDLIRNAVYEVEVGRFTLTTAGEITDLTRTLDAITGGTDASGDTYWKVGKITTNTLPAGSDAEFDMEYNEETGKYDITVGIPRGMDGSTTVFVGDDIAPTIRFDSDPQMQIDNLNNNTMKLTDDQTIDGVKNFVGELQVNGKDVSKISSLPIGAIVQLTCQTDDTGLHLADGSELAINGVYADFCNYVINNQSKFPTCSLSEYQGDISTYGECGKYVVSDTYVKLPTIKGIVQGTTALDENGNIMEAGLPNITGSIGNVRPGARGDSYETGAMHRSNMGHVWPCSVVNDDSRADYFYGFRINAHDSNSIYGNSATVQPQTIKYLYYIVIAATVKTDIEIDINNVLNDLDVVTDKVNQINNKFTLNVKLKNDITYTFGQDRLTPLQFEDGATSMNITTTGKPLVVCGNIFVGFTNMYNAYFDIYIDGNKVVSLIDTNVTEETQFGFTYVINNLSAGSHALEFKITGNSPANNQKMWVKSYNSHYISLFEI